MPPAPPHAPYRIETPRLVLRCWELADAPHLKTAVDASLETLRLWMPWAAEEPQTLEQKTALLEGFRARFLAGKDHIYGAWAPDGSAVLGGTGLHDRVGPGARETGYWVRVDAAGQGLATEMAAAMARVGFELLDLERMEIHCDTRNAPSAAIARKLGYTLASTDVGQAIVAGAGPGDQHVFTLAAADHPASPGAALAVQAFDADGQRLL